MPHDLHAGKAVLLLTLSDSSVWPQSRRFYLEVMKVYQLRPLLSPHGKAQNSRMLAKTHIDTLFSESAQRNSRISLSRSHSCSITRRKSQLIRFCDAEVWKMMEYWRCELLLMVLPFEEFEDQVLCGEWDLHWSLWNLKTIRNMMHLDVKCVSKALGGS